jgi:23S rRNA (uracil1939-C5)-methyltransferase
MVPRTVPGDRVRVRLSERHADYARAELLEVLAPGPGRREPPCPFFARCGGCDLQHLEDDLQARLKAAAAREVLIRIGGLELPSELPVVRAQAWGYRLRAQLQVARSELARVGVGYFERGSHQLVSIDRCPILTPGLEALVQGLPGELAGEERLPRRLDLAEGDRGFSCAPPVAGLPHDAIERQVGDVTLRFDARCFFQSHAGLLETLVQLAVGEDRGARAIDLYAGVGLFSMALASRYDSVVAVESDRIAARYLRLNAKENHRRNVTVRAESVEGWITELPESVDRVLVDPPRVGLSRSVCAGLKRRRPRHLTYVSCQAATLARDLRSLSATHRVDRVTALDLFPQTAHLEIVAQLSALDRE